LIAGLGIELDKLLSVQPPHAQWYKLRWCSRETANCCCEDSRLTTQDGHHLDSVRRALHGRTAARPAATPWPARGRPFPASRSSHWPRRAGTCARGGTA